MPTHGLLSCAIEIGESSTRLREYGTLYLNRTVETYVAIPSRPTPFSIRLSTNSYVAPGLSVWVYIDGVYQTNRNKRGAEPPDGKLEFHLGQKEDLLRDGRVIARGWWFEKLNIVNGDIKPTINEDVLDNLGTIEVVVLRCEDDPNSAPIDPWKFPQLPTAEKTSQKASTNATSLKQSDDSKIKAKALSVEDGAGSDPFGGMFGLFDGAGDEHSRRATITRYIYDDHDSWYDNERDEVAETSSEEDEQRHSKMPRDYGYCYLHEPASGQPPDRHVAHHRHGQRNVPLDRDSQTPPGSRSGHGKLPPRGYRLVSPNVNQIPRHGSRHYELHKANGLEAKDRDEKFERHDRETSKAHSHKYPAVEIPESYKPAAVPISIPNHLLPDAQHKSALYNRAQDLTNPYKNYYHPGEAIGYQTAHALGHAQHSAQHSPLYYYLPSVGYQDYWSHVMPAPSHPTQPQVQWQQPSADLPAINTHKGFEIQELEQKLHQLKTEPQHIHTWRSNPVPGPSLLRSANPNYAPSRVYAPLPFDPRKDARVMGSQALPMQNFPPIQSAEAQRMMPSWQWVQTNGHATQELGARSPSPGWDAASSASGSKCEQQAGDNDPLTNGWTSTNENDTPIGGITVTGQNNTGQKNEKDGWPGSNSQTDNNPPNGEAAGWETGENKSNHDDRGWNNSQSGDGQQAEDNMSKNSDNWNQQAGQENNQFNSDGWPGVNSNSNNKKMEDKLGKSNKPSRSSNQVEEKPYTRLYWHLRHQGEKTPADANTSRKRDRYTMPEDPIYTISKSNAKSKHLKHQVRGGKGAEQEKRIYKPIYWDSLEEPYAVFRFKYRSRGMLKKIIGEDISESTEEFQEWVKALSREQLVQEMLRENGRRMWGSEDDADDDDSLTERKKDGYEKIGVESKDSGAGGAEWNQHSGGAAGAGDGGGGWNGGSQGVNNEPISGW